MKHLWNLTNRFFTKDYASAVFLAANIISFTILPMITGILFCTIAIHLPIMSCLTDIMLTSIYAGIIFGLFGGILYLMRKPLGT